jgi:hypothetical protein
MSEMIEACPFCGDEVELCENIDEDGNSTDAWDFHCTGCDVVVQFNTPIESEAIEWWNRRVKPKPRPIAEAILDRLAAQFKHAVDNLLPSDKVLFKLVEMKAFLDEREQGESP